MAALRLEGISKSFGNTPVLDGVHLDIHEGEFLTLVGPSGCGKTTLLRIIAGLDVADAGSVSIDQLPVDELAPKARDVAMVFQSYALYPYMTVARNMALPLEMRSLSWAQRLPLLGRWWPGARGQRAAVDREVRTVAESLGLGGLLDRKPAQLSGGQRQRVALGRAMVRHPKVFLMDEPLSNLDAKLRVQTRTEITELHRRLGATFVYVTHDQVEAMTMSDRVALMMHGRILQLATPQVIYDDPCDLRVAEFIGTPKINALPAVRCESGLQVLGLVWPITFSDDAGSTSEGTVAVRPEWWSLSVGPSPVNNQACAVVGRVRLMELLGAETLVHVDVQGAAESVVAKVAPQLAAGLHVGATVRLVAPADRVLLFDGAGKRAAQQPAPVWREEQLG